MVAGSGWADRVVEVGVVEVEAASGHNFERAQLTSYAAPVRMREDGRDKLPVGTPDMPVQ